MKQQYLSDDMAPPHNLDIERALDSWQEAKDEQRQAAERTKLRHAALLLQMQNVGCEAYPYTDPKTGKKRQVIIAKEPKAKVTKPTQHRRQEDDVEIGEEVDASPDAPDDKVEKRRVKREKVAAEIDPFASTRAAMDEAAPLKVSLIDQAIAKQEARGKSKKRGKRP
jgi:hypothetical protein